MSDFYTIYMETEIEIVVPYTVVKGLRNFIT